MNWLDFFASMWKSALWPATVILTVILFRKQIKALLASIKSIKAQNFELIVSESLDSAEEESLLLPKKLTVGSKQGFKPLGNEVRAETAEEPEDTENQSDNSSPDNLIREAWYAVRRILWRVATTAGMTNSEKTKSLANLRWLARHKVVDAATVELIKELRVTYEIVRTGHGEINLSDENVGRYKKLSATVSNLLSNILADLEAKTRETHHD